MTRGCHERFKKAENKKNWKETAKDRTWRDLAEKAKTHKGFFLIVYACSITPG